jgi:signal transduction histidine kinase
MIIEYDKHFTQTDTSSQIAFRVKNAWTWPATAFLWSSLAWFFFANAALFNQLVCFVILASIGVFSATGYAPHLKTMKQFVNTMMISLLAAMAFVFITNREAAEGSLVYPIFFLQLTFWKLLLLIGNRLNQSHFNGLRLRKGNRDLIISLQKQTYRANQAVETKNRFLASAAHDIRQPVLALDLYASMLHTNPEMVVDLTAKIEIATKAVIAMFDSLFDLSRLDTGQLLINNSDVDIKKLMRDLELQYKPAADAKKLQLRMRCGDSSIHTDEQLLKRILGNLLMNAIKFTDVGGILLATRNTTEGVRFEVWDTGIGIPQSQQLAVLKEFYKSPSHKGTSEGFGLGLNIVTRFCEPLGFRFTMQSQIGRGSVFQVHAPKFPPTPILLTEEASHADEHKK